MIAQAACREKRPGAVLFQGEPFGQLPVSANQEQLRVGAADSEMHDSRVRQGAAAHKAVGRRARPAGFDRQAAHAEAKAQERTDHRGVVDCKTVWIFCFSIQADALPICFFGKLEKRIKEPAAGFGADPIIARLKLEIFGDVRIP